MKKLLAALLILALLIPAGITVDAESSETKPFYLVNWSSVGDDEEYTHVYPMIYLWASPTKVAEGEAYITCPSLGGSDPVTIAENIKEVFDTYPEGARYINFSPLHTILHEHAEVCFLDKGVPLAQKWLEEFLSYYSSIGGKLDGLTIDIEYTNIWASYIQGNFYNKDPLVYDWIVKHPTYQEKIRPELESRGFKFFPNPNEATPEIYSIHSNTGSAYAASRSIWNAVMRNYVGDVITQACAPLWEYYPDALVSDYQTKDSDAWQKDQELGSAGGNWTTAGNMSNENFYCIRPATKFFMNSTTKAPIYSLVTGYNNAVYERSPFNMFRFDNNVAKTSYLSCDNGNISWWIGGHHYGDVAEGSVVGTAFYTENLLHLGMLDPQIYLGYILQQDALEDDYDDWVLSLRIVDDVLKELTRVVGGADREPINVMPAWNDYFVLSGMHVGGKNIWRLTPDTTYVSLEAFKIEGSDPTFRVNGQTITFPGGKIIETGTVRNVGTCGYWIETPENVNPVITRVSDFYKEYPAFQEDFESYKAGTAYDYNNALPVTCWETTKQGGGSGTVIADPADANNQVLEIKGTYTAKNVNIPKNITAGDTYAEHQAWQISFTLPADMAADAEVVLLNVTNEKKKANDGGFKIAGGKVYYSQEGEYAELAGVTLTAGTKYTVVRDMDFSDPENFTCDYYVYGPDGSLLGKAMDVAIEELVLSIYSISFGCTKVAGEAVLLDDYKLYPTYVATDFYLYDADTGMAVTETEKARQGSTAYRLSWLNATGVEKTYSVVAAYYSGETKVSETVVREVKMAPDFEGIITGVVEKAADGKTMLVYLRDDTPTDPVGNDPNGGSAEEPGTDSKLIIIIAVATAAVVLIAVIVTVAVVSAKRKKKTVAAEQADTPEENDR